MSDRSESDDEFESADEGDDYTDESCSEEGSDEENLKEEPTSEEAAISEVLSSQETKTLEAVNELIPETPESLVNKLDSSVEFSVSTQCSNENPETVCDGLDAATALETSNLEDEPIQDAKFTEEIVELQNDLTAAKINPVEQIPTADISASELNVATKTIPSDILHEDVEIPAEIANKISTRSISSSRGKIRTKPVGLGAKKLGAVKLSQPPAPVSPALEKLDSEETSRVQTDSTSQQVDDSSKKIGDEDSWNDSSAWSSWFAPPKSLITSVSSIKNQIISTVENVVENGLNIPEPEELAKQELLFAGINDTEVDEKMHKQQAQQEQKSSGFFGGVSNITKFVESTGSSLFSTGLDTLELLGKKTINVLQQTDPGLKRTKAVLINPLQGSNDRPCLSQILREAKESGEMTNPDSAQATAIARGIPKLTALFELHNGLVHLEALEMLSQQCQSRVTPQIRRLTSQRKAVIEEIEVLCSRVDDSEDQDSVDSDLVDLQTLEQNLSSSFDRIGVEISLKKLMNAFREGISDSVEVDSSLEQYRSALDSLAFVTSLAVELLHKSAELILMADKPSNPTVGARLEAETFQCVTSLLTSEIAKLGNHHANKTIIQNSDTTNYSTDIYYEASNCRSYLQNALKLMIPVLQSRIF